MEKSFADILVDEMKVVIFSIRQETGDMFKNKRKFREFKVSDEERINKYLSIPDGMRQRLAQDYGDDYLKWESDMEEKIRRFSNA